VERFISNTVGGEYTYSGVAVPQVHVDLRNGFAGVGVDQLDVHVERNTLLGLRDVFTNQFTRDI
jgi:hypothetical protein